MRCKIFRACTVSMSIDFVAGMLPMLKERYEVILLSSPGLEMDVVTEKYGVRGIRISMERHISLFHDIVSLWHIIQVFRKENPMMVHSMTPKAGLLCMLAAWLTRVPVRVHTFTGLVFPTATGLKKIILMLTDWLTCACATHIIPEGEGVKNDLLNHEITKKPLKVLGYGNVKGVDLHRFNGKRCGGKGRIFCFLFVGRVVKDKGINELIEAFVQLNQNYPQSKLVLVGPFESNLDPVSEETCRVIDSCPSIESVGEKQGEELVSYYAAADCFVFPSYREGFPNTVLEAGAMRLPCIVTDINGSREIIEDEKNGLIVPPKDPVALCHAMERMLTDNESRKRMGGDARKIIEERFDQDFVRQCLLDYYDEILKPYV